MYSDVDVVKSRTNIVDIVSEYVKLTKAGSNFKACCPFHQEKTPSFNVNEDKQFYHCFGCGQGGDVFAFVMEMEGIGFREALEMLAEKAGVELQNNFVQGGASGDEKKKMYDALDLSAQFYEKQLWDGIGKDRALGYLQGRGLSDETIKKFRLGFAPDGWSHIDQFLMSKDMDNALAASVGMLIKKDDGGYYDRFRDRIMFPICDHMGRVIGFTARAMPGDDEAQAKYINTPETALYHKSSVLYGIHHAKQAIKQIDDVVVVEGNMDVIAAQDAGIENVIAVSGTAMTDEHIRMLKRYAKHFTLFFDADDAGMAAARRSAIACLAADIQLSMVLLSEGKDAADIVKDDPAQLRTIIAEAENAIVAFIDIAKKKFNMSDPHGKRQAIEFVAEVISHIDNDIEREEWANKCADMFDTETRLVLRSIEKFRSDNAKESSQYVSPETSAMSKVEQSQMQRIYRSIILMMMAYPHVWEHIYNNRERYGPVMEQKNITALMREGPECNFSIGDFIKKSANRESLYKAAMKMQQEYETEHEDGGSPISDVETYISVALEAINKRKMDYLLTKMNEAEENADHNTQKKILEEINILSQQIIHNT
jgi:DNA primase